jgi:hypothetical protein
VSGSDGDCSYSGSHSFSFSPQPTQPSFTIYNPASDVVNGSPDKDWVLPFEYNWAIYPPPSPTFTYTITCTGSDPSDAPISVADLGTGHGATTNDGVTFSGSAGETTFNFHGSD